MDQAGVLYLLWSDLVGITRTRGIPLSDWERRRESGLGWAMAGQALTAFEDIVDNVWGPMDEARQTPDPEARFTIAASGAFPAIDTVICDSRQSGGEDWPACTRTFLRDALDTLENATGLTLISAFEHEFLLHGEGLVPRTPFSLAAALDQHALLTDLADVLGRSGLPPETVEPEFGLGQYEVSGAPHGGVRGADIALMTRETIREIVRRHGLRASFTPKPAPDAVGNGCHMHVSLADGDGTNVTHDPDGPMGLSETAAWFCAGILDHAEALVAITAPTPISYYRLGPHHWSCGFRAIGVQNREAMLRIVPGVGADTTRRRQGFNIEYRPMDATASPYLALGVMIHAGLDGISRKLTLPPAIDRDPADLTDSEQKAMDIAPLPASLDAALDALEADTTALSWLPRDISETFIRLKRWECAFAADNEDAHVFERYRDAY